MKLGLDDFPDERAAALRTGNGAHRVKKLLRQYYMHPPRVRRLHLTESRSDLEDRRCTA